MKKQRHTMQKDWKDPRAEIERIVREKKIDESRFRRLSMHEDWKSIRKSIYDQFCQIDHQTLRSSVFWDVFKYDSFRVGEKGSFQYLNQLVDQHERVWFFLTEDNRKFWFYEGFIKEIVQIIGETSYVIEELYISSKKYEWFICITEYDSLIVTGGTMPEKLRSIRET